VRRIGETGIHHKHWLAPMPGAWHGGPMDEQNRNQGRAGGVFIALGALAGAGIGIAYREPSLGLIMGVAGGGAVAILLWLANRR
jgi:hypothetical protein